MKKCISISIICSLIFLSGCMSVAPLGATDVSNNSTVSKAPIVVESTEGIESFVGVRRAETIEKAMSAVIALLDKKETEYHYIKRDYFYINGIQHPAQWLFVINEFGEWADIVFFSEDMETVNNWFYGPQKGVAELSEYRRNEAYSYNHRVKYPHYDTGLGNAILNQSDNGVFTYYLTGQLFAMNDIGNAIGSGEYYWEGKKITTGRRPYTTCVPVYPNETSRDYQCYMPSNTMEGEMESIIHRLVETDTGYRWEIRDRIVVNSVEYPVMWLYAYNEEGRWVDAVLSSDPDFAYFLHANRAFFQEIRKSFEDSINGRYPERLLSDVNAHEWIVQDVFYYGYSLYLDGDGVAIQDCGSVAQMNAWNPDKNSYCTYFSRDCIWGENYIPDYEHYK